MRIVLDDVRGAVEFRNAHDAMNPEGFTSAEKAFCAAARDVVAEVGRGRDHAFSAFSCAKMARRILDLRPPFPVAIERRSRIDVKGPCLGCGGMPVDVDRAPCPRPSLKAKLGRHVFDHVGGVAHEPLGAWTGVLG